MVAKESGRKAEEQETHKDYSKRKVKVGEMYIYRTNKLSRFKNDIEQ